MSQLSDPVRRYSVRVRHAEPRHGHVVAEATFEAAAVAYIEDFPLAPDHGAGISLIVRDIESGREHCFHIDLETGETTACA
jgi:hypothetical protein